MHFDEGLRVDLLVDGCLVIELKFVEKLAPVHAKQLLTYLRFLNLPVGLLINFGAATFKEGIRRVVNKHQDFASSRERFTPNDLMEGLTDHQWMPFRLCSDPSSFVQQPGLLEQRARSGVGLPGYCI
ncbi:MAG: GxxExxY protein [Euryarchaeota archaeon]|nr:GxxExxY protein [Euryarchaeota archaeon]